MKICVSTFLHVVLYLTPDISVPEIARGGHRDGLLESELVWSLAVPLSKLRHLRKLVS